MYNFNTDRYGAFFDEGPVGFGGPNRHGGDHDHHGHCRGESPRRESANLGGFRARRGSVGPMVLMVLRDGPKTGYEIILSFEERSLGAWRPSPGSIYPTLDALEKKGLVRMLTDDDRKTYELTEEGLAFTKKMDEKFAGHWDMANFKEMSQIRNEISEVMALVRTVMSEKDKEKNKELMSILGEFKTSLYVLCDSTGNKKAEK
ncbi:MAG: PadR family transcriptional regulator [Candidatus Methanoplasma sp.]|jgi:DNA-binding PadR family transcriptional regulator|nr:PadR family transcriptional regulator [Candidatus Methanoplasma sp.]